jgi:DNA-binding MarR family transcriptional regulator
MSADDETRLFIQLQTLAAEQMEAAAQLLKQHGLTSPQYNVLRILRGAGAPLKCTEIGNRMWTRDSDVTRLLDRLESRGLAARCRSTEDRRALEIGITEAGLSLLKELDEPVKLIHQQQFAALSPDERQALATLLNKLAES